MTRRLNLRKAITIPNLLSLCRLAVLPLILFLMVQRKNTLAFVVLLLFWATDALDGFLARRLHQESELGKILDPLVDKVSMGLIVLTLAATKGLPIWLALIIVTRDVLILIGSIFVFSSRQSVAPSDIIGKITGFCFAALITVYILNLTPLMKPALYVICILVLASFVNYSVRFVRLMNQKGNKQDADRNSATP